MPTFLELCQRVRQECGVAGEVPAVTNQTGVFKKIVERTARAWTDIQAARPYWDFMRSQNGPTSLVIGQREYTLTAAPFSLTNLSKFDPKAAFIYETSTADETKLDWITYDAFRVYYRTYPDGRPTRIYQGLNGVIGFDFTPDKTYKVTLDYWKTATILAANTDVPSLPEQYHDVIVWKSVMMFAGSESATELYNYAKSMYTPLYHELLVDQGALPGSVNSYAFAFGQTYTTRPGF